MPANSERTDLDKVKKFLSWIAQQSSHIPNDDADKKIHRLYEKLSMAGFTPFEGNTLWSVMNKDENKLSFDLSSKSGYIYLNPEEKSKDVLPILTFKYDFTGGKSELRLRLAFFKLAPMVGNHEKIRATGFRFESCEGEGSHNYFHAQPITRFARDGKSLPCEAWMPDTYPTFPLEADSHVGLIMTLMCSVYNQNMVRSMSANNMLWQIIKSSVENYYFVRNSTLDAEGAY